MSQGVKYGLQPHGACTLTEYERDTKNKKTSYKVGVLETPPPIAIYNCAGIKFVDNASYNSPPENILQFKVCLLKYLPGYFVGCQVTVTRVPSTGRFIKSTGSVPEKKTTIDYCKTIHQPITQYETVQELLLQSREATKAVCQKYTTNTFDLRVCMKALPLKWTFPDIIKVHVVVPVSFHTEMNFTGMVTNHNMQGSGYAEIIEESWLVTKGCMKNKLIVKAFAKTLFSLKAVNEAPEHLLLKVFCEEYFEIHPACLLTLTDSCNRGNLDTTLNDQSTSPKVFRTP